MENDRFRSKLSAYRDGELDDNLRDAVSAHLRNCAACREELAEFEQVDSLVKKMPELEATRYFDLEIIAAISRQKRDRLGSAPFAKRVLARFLQLADSFLELVAGDEEEADALDEFSDFPPLSMSYAYFRVIGELR